MKIMMAITGMQSGGAERVMATLCNELSKRHEVCLLIMKTAQSDYSISDRVEVVAGSIENQNLLKCVQFTKREITRRNPDVILSFMTKTNIILLLAAMQTGMSRRVVLAERANPYNAKSIFRIMRRFLYPHAGGAVFQTVQAQKYYDGIIKSDSIVLKNPLNPDFDDEAYEGIRRKAIVTMGRLSVEKNQKLLVEAFSKIALKYTEYIVEIYGDGPLKEELQRQIDSSGLNKRVLLMGRKDRVRDYVKDASIFVLPSNSEGMPNALLEAMALGIPSIATDCPIGGSAFIIRDHENGLLLPMNDADALAQALAELIQNRVLAEKLGRNGRKVTEDFAAEKVSAEWEAYLKEVANRGERWRYKES